MEQRSIDPNRGGRKKRGVYALYFHKFHFQDPVDFLISLSLKRNKTNINLSDHVKVVGLEFEQLIKSFSKINLAKIDTERGEFDLFESLMRNLKQIEYILVDLHQDRAPNPKEKPQEFSSFISSKGLENNWLLDWE